MGLPGQCALSLKWGGEERAAEAQPGGLITRKYMQVHMRCVRRGTALSWRQFSDLAHARYRFVLFARGPAGAHRVRVRRFQSFEKHTLLLFYPASPSRPGKTGDLGSKFEPPNSDLQVLVSEKLPPWAFLVSALSHLNPAAKNDPLKHSQEA